MNAPAPCGDDLPVSQESLTSPLAHDQGEPMPEDSSAASPVRFNHLISQATLIKPFFADRMSGASFEFNSE